jgi:putative spermidine/putrescine transport system substrate-binding protein
MSPTSTPFGSGPSNEHLARSLMNRRAVLRSGLAVGGLTAMAPLLAACGKGGKADAGGGIAGTVNFLGYVAYDLKYPQMEQWTKTNGIKLKSTYITDQGEVTSKLSTGSGRGVYNLSIYSGQYGSLYKQLGLFSEIDTSKIPNYADSLPFFRSGPAWERYFNIGGKQYGIPFTWGYMGINYDSAKMSAPTKTADFLKPDMKGKFAMADDMIAMILMTAQSLGIAKQDGLFTKRQLADIVNFLKSMKKNARTLANGFGDIANMYASGEIQASISGFTGMETLVQKQGKTTVKTVIPAEGTFSFADAFFVPARAKDVDTVYAFINHGLDPAMQPLQADYEQAAITTKRGAAALSPKQRALFPYDNLDALFAKAPMFDFPIKAPSGYASLADWTSAWESVKA